MEAWQKHLVGLATAVITEVFIGSYLALIGRCQDDSLQTFNVLVTKAHMLDESVHHHIFAALAKDRLRVMSTEQQAFFRAALPQAVAWYVQNRLSAWREIRHAY